MNKTIVTSMLFALIAFAAPATAEEKTLEQRVSDLEASAPSLPAGLFVNGELEIYYDDDTYTSDIEKTPQEKQKELDEKMKAFLAKGGVIEKVPAHKPTKDQLKNWTI